MSCEKKFKDELKDRGFRVTPQREAILEALHQVHGCTTAEALHESIQDRDPGVDLATVYRTLELLAELDFAKCIETGRKKHVWEFLGAEEPHPHLLCRACGKLYGAEERDLAPLRRYLQETYGFEADIGQITIPGLCPKCRRPEGTG